MITVADVEAVIWSQARNLTADDDLQRQTAMDVIRVAITAHAESQAGQIVAARRKGIEANR